MRKSDHWTIEKPATEIEALISSGELIRDRIHDLAQDIEEHVKKALSDNPESQKIERKHDHASSS